MFDVFYPGRMLLYDSARSVDELTRRLEREVAPPQMALFDRRQQLFEGTFVDRRFTVIRASQRALRGNRDKEGIMHRMAAFVLMMGCVAPPALATQARTGGPGVRACAVLTRDLVVPFTANKQVLDLIPASEESMGTSGSACDWGGVRLQLFPIARGQQKRTAPVKDMQPLPGAGEAAFFRSNRDRYAELVVYTAAHYFTLQVSVPTGSTAEAIKPDTVKLANAIAAKLR
jgi:hypothetical protein